MTGKDKRWLYSLGLLVFTAYWKVTRSEEEWVFVESAFNRQCHIVKNTLIHTISFCNFASWGVLVFFVSSCLFIFCNDIRFFPQKRQCLKWSHLRRPTWRAWTFWCHTSCWTKNYYRIRTCQRQKVIRSTNKYLTVNSITSCSPVSRQSKVSVKGIKNFLTPFLCYTATKKIIELEFLIFFTSYSVADFEASNIDVWQPKNNRNRENSH